MTCEACYCSRCAPLPGAAAQCSVCGQEIRLGYRDGVKNWWHREAVDHAPIQGHRITYAQRAENERFRREHVWYDDEGRPYTTAEWEIGKDKDPVRRRRRLAELRGEDPDYVEPIPEPEVRRTPVEIDDDRVPGGAKTMARLVAGITRVTPGGKTSKSPKHPPMAPGWELARLTYARGPYLGADGSVLSISDTIVMGARGPEVDGGVAIAVASWRDGKFDTAYTGVLKDGVAKVDPANADQLKSWIKEAA